MTALLIAVLSAAFPCFVHFCLCQDDHLHRYLATAYQGSNKCY